MAPAPAPAPSFPHFHPPSRPTHSAFRIGPVDWRSGTVKEIVRSLFRQFHAFALLNERFFVNLEENNTFARVSFTDNGDAASMFKQAFEENSQYMPREWHGRNVTVTVCAPRQM